MRKFWFTKDNILGGVAKWAIQQSPYDMPDNLEIALKNLNEVISPYFRPDEEFLATTMTYEDIIRFVFESMIELPQIRAWNEPKIKSDHPLVGTSSRFHRTKPDYDFIDLHAMARNIANDIVWEAEGGKTPIPVMLGEGKRVE